MRAHHFAPAANHVPDAEPALQGQQQDLYGVIRPIASLLQSQAASIGSGLWLRVDDLDHPDLHESSDAGLGPAVRVGRCTSLGIPKGPDVRFEPLEYELE